MTLQLLFYSISHKTLYHLIMKQFHNYVECFLKTNALLKSIICEERKMMGRSSVDNEEHTVTLICLA